MTRRAAAHDYTRPGIYHITMHVADGLGHPLGAVVGSIAAPDGTPDAPHTALTPIGQMVEHELLTAIHARYPMITIQDYVIMPEHIHFLMVVQDRIVSQNGKTRTIGQIIAGFKQGCNRRYWEMLERQAKPAATLTAEATSPSAEATSSLAEGPSPFAVSVHSGFAAVNHPTLFAAGYCDVMPVDERQLATQRAYIKGNPRNRPYAAALPWPSSPITASPTAITPLPTASPSAQKAVCSSSPHGVICIAPTTHPSPFPNARP